MIRLPDYIIKIIFSKVAEILKEKTDEDWLLVCSNIKDFKLINDLFGIEKGNEVLKNAGGHF